MRRRLLIVLVTLVGCRDFSPRHVDGGRFEIPDSGLFLDARAAGGDGSTPADVGPFTCREACADGGVCSCLDTRPPRCGCNAPGGYAAPCDLLVPESCRWPYACVMARKVDGLHAICSDGREGTPCLPSDQSCNTSRGCICISTPIGIGCSCQGNPGTNPLLCDPTQPDPCPGGRCVRVDTTAGGLYICSTGEEYEPCNPGDGVCKTSLGCTCPLVSGRESCRCSEPGDVSGEPCDIRVLGACVAPLECIVLRGSEIGDFYTECARNGGADDAGVDPLGCDPLQPLCPPAYSCQEVGPGRFRCRPDA
ncbi:MAG: hypothetical protein IT384_34600 [Deltaproteobacteria bacterium]|nr:hypothetical protein [Deltaproteobacteria bacterium]